MASDGSFMVYYIFNDVQNDVRDFMRILKWGLKIIYNSNRNFSFQLHKPKG